jgi:putative addiction module CopG family antidote
MRTSKPISITLGPQQASLERRLKSGQYQSASEVLRHALRALDRQDAILEEALRERSGHRWPIAGPACRPKTFSNGFAPITADG